MFRGLVLAGAALALAGPATAQIMLSGPRAERQAPARDHGLRERLFISPSGEPFRGGDGLAAWFARADADHDGAVTLAEFEADAMAFFKRLDADGNGVVDGFETQAYERTIAPEIARLDFGLGVGGERRPRRGHGPGGKAAAPRDGVSVQVDRASGVGREGAARWSLIDEPEPVAQADANVDSRVTAAEWRRATLRRFQALDTAKTGRLTLGALRARLPPARKGRK
jgi:hypothetical protein